MARHIKNNDTVKNKKAVVIWRMFIAGLLTVSLALSVAGCASNNAGSPSSSGGGDSSEAASSSEGENSTTREQVESATGIDLDNFGGLQWRVLTEEGDRTLVISEDIVEIRAYHGSREAITWENSDIRNYLNGEFLNRFSDEEQALIFDTLVINTENHEYGTDGGNDTIDRVFLLSIDEANRYFFGDSDRIARWQDASYLWLLRSPGENPTRVAIVIHGGRITNDSSANSNIYGIRPALWLNL
jgi:hypothetical protein